jgi:hypothetical protein
MLRGEVIKGIVGLMLILFPALFLSSAFIKPFLRTLERKTWMPVSCSIVSCEISESGGGVDATTDTNLHIVYTYKIDNTPYTCRTLDNYPNLGQGWDLAQKYKEMFCSSEPVQCYVNPADPTEAVLYRSFFRPISEVKRFFLIPFFIPFLVLGFWLVISSVRRFRTLL